jgi:hypothetical protein
MSLESLVSVRWRPLREGELPLPLLEPLGVLRNPAGDAIAGDFANSAPAAPSLTFKASFSFLILPIRFHIRTFSLDSFPASWQNLFRSLRASSSARDTSPLLRLRTSERDRGW